MDLIGQFAQLGKIGTRLSVEQSHCVWDWCLYILLLFSFGLRFFQLGTGALWFDEILQLQLSRATPDVIVGALRTLPLGPAYTFLLKGWIVLARFSDLVVRFLPACGGVLGIALFYRYLRIWLSEPVALVGCLLLTLSPFHLYFSQEGRLYTLDVALLLAALIVFHLMLKGQKKRWVVLNGLLIALLGYSHYTALVVVGGQVAWLLVMYLTNWQSWKRAWMSWALAFLAMLVILPSAYQGLRLVYGSYQSTLQVWSTLQTVAAGFGKYGAFPKYDGELVRQIAPLTLLSLVVLGLLAWKSAREIWAVMVGVMGLQFGWTFVVLPLIGGLSNPSFNERHFLWNVPMVLSVAALGVECAFRHPSRLIRLVAGLLVGTTVILYSAGDVGYFVAYTKGSRVAVDFVSRQADQQDLILFNTRSASATWSLYGKPQLAVWDKPKPVDGQWQFSPQVSFAFGQVIEWTHTWREAITYPRVWVFYLIGQGPPELMSSLRIVYPREHVWTFGNLEVFLFER